MKSISFNSFLKNYIKELSNQNTLNISKLATEAEYESPRLIEPLVLYSYFCVDKSTANRQLVNSGVFETFKSFSKKYPNEESALKYLKCTENPLDSFQKVYKSFLVQANREICDHELKDRLRAKILLLQKEKNVSTAMLLKNDKLRLNKGNIYGFMRGNVNLMSLEKVHSILVYLNEQF